ncbi:hypothetical protein DPMN_128427 [Dreissena polymorpha]|uniref:Uncharacterized protein n=1 Tax=Dreissena polymorpha TaxID=45954 RepID=A0A9D4JWE9_DREPO|nr:hypothetical protein DPMN_128427 [Dreissena polymorpha]
MFCHTCELYSLDDVHHQAHGLLVNLDVGEQDILLLQLKQDSCPLYLSSSYGPKEYIATRGIFLLKEIIPVVSSLRFIS